MHKRLIHAVTKMFSQRQRKFLSVGIVLLGVFVAGAIMLGHGVYQKHVVSLQPEKIGLGSGVAACYSSVGLSCSGNDVYYSATWDYGYMQNDTPNCGTHGDLSVLFGVKDGANNWVQSPQDLACANGAGAVRFSATNNATYYGVVVGKNSGTEFHREAFTAPSCSSTPPPQPSDVWGTCDASGGATISWNGAWGASDYYPRIYTPNGNCSSGWTLASDGHTCYKNSTGGSTSVHVDNILPNTSYNIWVHSGLPFNPNGPASSSFTCGTSGNLNVYSCSISGGSTCSTPYDWSSSNTPNGTYITAGPLNNGSAWMIYPGAPSAGNSAVDLWAGTFTFNLYDTRSNALLDTANVTITGGEPGGWLTANDCTIPAGSNKCNTNVSWDISNASARVIQANGGMYGTGRNLDQPGEPSFGSTPSSWTNWSLPIDYNPNGHDISAAGCLLSGCNTLSDWRYVGTTHVYARCAAGTIWDGSVCATYPAAPPTITASCLNGSQVFLQWPKVSSSAKYYLRVYTPNGSCPGGWTLYSDGHTCYVDGLNAASHCSGSTCTVAFPTVSGQTYSSWVHSGDPVNWSLYAQTRNFVCRDPNNLAWGYLDSATCTEAKGWVVDPDSLTANSKVHAYIDSGTASQIDLGLTTANIPNAGVNSYLGIPGDHGFSISLPASIKDGVPHKISVFGVDLQTNQSKQLELSPKFVTCVNLSASCSVSPSTIDEGDSATWSASISGGTAPYTYSWAGTDGLSGSGASVTKTYADDGTKTATITVTDATGATLGPIACTNNLTVTDNALNISCSASPSSISEGDSATWSASVSGGRAPFTYAWTGTDGLSGSGASVTKTYAYNGTKTASLTVSDSRGGSAGPTTCSNLAVNCASGYALQGGVCTPTCTPACGSNASCVGVNICSCNTGYVMVSGVCTAPPSITNFTVSPTRIRPGTATKISWSSVGADSCTVVGQNGYTKSGLTKTNDDSGPITSETDFTLTCTNAAGSVSETATVFLLPTYQDQ